MPSEHFVVTSVLAVVALLFMATLIAAVTNRLKLPLSVTLVCVGLTLGWLGRLLPALAPISDLTLSPEVLTYIFMPTLIFEAAFAINARMLGQNLLQVMLLSVPVLIVSFLLVAFGMHWAIGLPIGAALLFGAFVSATDSAAVLGVLQEIGAPKRLNVIIQGENLLNDATSIVLFNIVVAAIGMAAAQSIDTADMLTGAVASFCWNFFGGLVAGAAMGWATSKVIYWIENDDLIEVVLTTSMAYLSMVVAEVAFGVSGIMAVTGCGLVMSGYGRTKYSAATLDYLVRFWAYLAFVANALIFLLIGLMIDLAIVFQLAGPIFWAILIATGARAAAVFGLFPLVNRLPSIERVDLPHQTVFVWGGLRGAMTLVLAMSLPESFAERDLLIALAFGVVLFSVLGQGPTLQPLMRALGLQRATAPELYVRDESRLTAKSRARERISELREAGVFSERVTRELETSYGEEQDALRAELARLRERGTLGTREEFKLIKREFLLVEKRVYQDLFHRGQLSERVLQELQHSIELQIDHIRYGGSLPAWTIHSPLRWKLEGLLFRGLDAFFPRGRLGQHYRLNRIADLYEQHWGRLMASRRVIEELERLADQDANAEPLVVELKDLYGMWHRNARRRLDAIGEQFPEYATKVQQLMVARLCLQAEEEVIDELLRLDVLPERDARLMREEVQRKLRLLRQKPLEELRPRPRELLAKVPSFRDLPADEFDTIADLLRPRTMLADEIIVREGEIGDSLFLIGRGVVHVTTGGDGVEIMLATLLAGEFFGEIAVLTSNPRSATCTAATHCVLYELRRVDLDAVQMVCPALRQVLESTAAERRQNPRSTKA